MKIIVAFLLILCVSCGTAAAQSSPAPAPSSAPDYRPCLTVLAYLAVHHEHKVTVGDIARGTYAHPAGLHPEDDGHPFLSVGTIDSSLVEHLVDEKCSGVMDADTVAAINSYLHDPYASGN